MHDILPKYNYSLLPHNTFGIEASTKCFIAYDSVAQLRQAIAFCSDHCHDLPVLHIGAGSNLLFLSNFSGVVLHSQIKGVEVVEKTSSHVLVRVGAGMIWDEWVAYSLTQGWYGLENLSLIPGEVGASAVQNIGAYGAEAAQFIHSVECCCLKNGDSRVFGVDECAYGYRSSIFKHSMKGKYAITHVVFRLSLTFTPNLSYQGLSSALKGIDAEMLTADEVRRVVIDVRRNKLPDPLVQGNAGSFFMNPVVPMAHYNRIKEQYPLVPSFRVDETSVKIPAAWLIEQCGWKGRTLGRAAVHAVQPLCLVNAGGATGEDILLLCRKVQADVEERFGIVLHPEVIMI